MPSYVELAQEDAWRDEVVPPALQDLAEALRASYGVGAAAIGVKGDNRHLSGYHRSRRWVKTSQYCENRTYSVSRTAGDRSGGNENWCCALDIGGIGQSKLHALCKRLDTAIRSGKFEKVTQWYGSFGGDDRVDGYDNISNRVASADSSHLFHAHLSFDRGRANENHDDLLAVLIGEDMTTPSDVWNYVITTTGQSAQSHLVSAREAAEEARDVALRIEEKLDQLIAAGGSPDTAAILAGVQDLLGDFGRGGAAAADPDGPGQ